MEPTMTKTALETYFEPFRKNTLGVDATFQSPYGEKRILYGDWIASGRLYRPIEEAMCEQFGPRVANTHSELSETGISMTHSYHYAQQIIKKHVNANEDDVLIACSTGMTGAMAKFQRILGVRMPEKLQKFVDLPEEERPVVFITHMEHHSNHTPWLESIVDLVIVPPDENLLVKPEALEAELKKYANRKIKIGSFSACSNVTGIMPPYYELARIMHRHGGYCFVDFAASAPYVDIDMHPEDPEARLDAVLFSPHKFLGGPGSSGVLVFSKHLYKNRIPDHPGGGTVYWTNPWGNHAYIDDIEVREDGGTPGFLQTIRTALAIRLKEKMGVENILKREEELMDLALEEIRKIPRVHILGDNGEKRIAVISFYLDGIHHNLMTAILNDRYGIQVRSGCHCAGTYGHYLLDLDMEKSNEIFDRVGQGDLSLKPGWVRLSLHPTMTNEELLFITNAIREVVENIDEWSQDYEYSTSTNIFSHKSFRRSDKEMEAWFEID